MEGDRPCDCFRFRYLRATKNIAAPYAAAPQTTPAAMPTDFARTGDELSTPLIGTPSLPGSELEDVDGSSLPLPGAIGVPNELSPLSGMAGLIIDIMVLTLGLLLL